MARTKLTELEIEIKEKTDSVLKAIEAQKELRKKEAETNNQPLPVDLEPILPVVSQKTLAKMSIKQNRTRFKEFPSRLPTSGMMPLPVDEHEHIGNYESKQNLYLITAHAFNTLMEKLESLEQEVKKLKG